MNSLEDRVLDRVERWHDLRLQGAPVSLAELCRDAPELLPEVERHLAFVLRVDRLLVPDPGETSAPRPPATPAPLEKADPPTPDTTPTIPNHDLLGRLGEGGMGTVYRARDRRLGRVVAVKVIKAGLVGTTELARFQVEAETVARLNHPHIVQLYEVGRWQPSSGDALPYLTLEYIDGDTLQKRLASRRPEPQEAAQLVRLLARAVRAAHDKGVVHRDLKPGNVLLAPPADEPALNCAWGWPKLADFGLARPVAGSTGITGDSIVGTPAYMAPEQARGDKGVGPPTDVYGLGGILYWLLTGRPPFTGRNAVEALSRAMTEAPKPPRQIRPEVPEDLEALCLRCLEKDPAKRPTVGQLLEGLGGTRTFDPRETIAVLVPRQPWRRRSLVVTLALAAALVTAGLAWALWPRGTGPSMPIKGDIDLIMSRPGDRLRQLVRLSDPAARPLRPGDEVRVVAKVSRPAYLYVLWIDAAGEAGPVYPWVEGDWRRRRDEKPTRELSLPEGRPDEVFRISDGASGMETLLLLARDTPLPADVDVPALLGRQKPARRPQVEDLREVAWFENGELVRGERERKPDLKNPVASSNPLLRLQGALQDRLGQHFAYARSVSFGNQGSR